MISKKKMYYILLVVLVAAIVVASLVTFYFTKKSIESGEIYLKGDIPPSIRKRIIRILMKTAKALLSPWA